MANLRVHNIIDAFCGAKVIDNEEFLFLHEINRPRNPRFSYERYSFNFEEMTEDECWSEFRCRKVDIPQLVTKLSLQSSAVHTFGFFMYFWSMLYLLTF